MHIAGLHKFSLIDYPGLMSAVVFTRGCNFRCPFCHNNELVLPELYPDCLSHEDIFSFLRSRIGKLQGVVITGGEPTLHGGLARFCRQVKAFGFKVKLDTNGSNPGMLSAVLAEQLVDYVAMDIKAPWYKYEMLAGIALDVDRIRESMMIIRDASVSYEFRTTYAPGLTDEDMATIQTCLLNHERYTVQEYQVPGIQNKAQSA